MDVRGKLAAPSLAAIVELTVFKIANAVLAGFMAGEIFKSAVR